MKKPLEFAEDIVNQLSKYIHQHTIELATDNFDLSVTDLIETLTEIVQRHDIKAYRALKVVQDEALHEAASYTGEAPDEFKPVSKLSI